MSTSQRQIAAPTTENTALAVVCYHPEEAFQDKLGVFAGQFPVTFIVDNSEPATQWLEGADGDRIRITPNGTNPGLARALNQACQAALDAGFEWVVTLDQDTDIREDFLQIMVDGWQQAGGRTALLGSNYFSVSRGKHKIEPGGKNGTSPQKTVITSGSLMHLPSWRQIGRFRDEYFIDSIDHEYCLRTRRAGLEVKINHQSAMQHTIGDSLSYGSFLNRLLPFRHTPARKYTSARNTTRTVVEYAGFDPAWCIKQLVGLLAELLSIVLFEPKKWLRIKCFFTGVKHGWCNEMGTIPPEILGDSTR